MNSLQNYHFSIVSLSLQFLKISCFDGLLFIIAEGILRESTNVLTLEVEHIGDSTASQSDESEEGASPLVAQSVVHLLCKQNSGGAPHRTEEGLGCESRCCLVLVGIH